jgi:hypothetical protein
LVSNVPESYSNHIRDIASTVYYTIIINILYCRKYSILVHGMSQVPARFLLEEVQKLCATHYVMWK